MKIEKGKVLALAPTGAAVPNVDDEKIYVTLSFFLDRINNKCIPRISEKENVLCYNPNILSSQ